MAADPVEQAIREGKIPESRRGYYYNLFARKPRRRPASSPAWSRCWSRPR